MQESPKIRVVVADDTLLVREGAQRLLEACDNIDIFGVADSLDGLLLAVQDHEPDVVVTDIRMPPTFSGEGIRAAVCRFEHAPAPALATGGQGVTGVRLLSGPRTGRR